MATNRWRYLINAFEVNTRGSHVKGLSLATDHDAKLHAEDADPDILALHTPYHAVYQAYAQICAHFDSVSGIHKGLTVSLEALLRDDLPDQLRLWEGVVRAVHPEDSPEEVMIFPNKRTPFLQTTYEDRISAINSLIESLQENGGFPALVTQVQSYYNLALSTRDTQQQQEGLIGQSADLRENQRLLVMQEMQGNFGRLVQKFRTDIDSVERFFDMSMLRQAEGDGDENPPSEPQLFNGTLNPAISVTVDATLTAASELTIQNHSLGAQTFQIFCSASMAAGPQPGDTPITVNAGATEVRTAALLGFSPTRPFLNIFNPGPLTVNWSVEVA